MKTKILVNGHDQKFWYPIQEYLEKNNFFEFKEDVWEGHEKHDIQKSESLIKWADIIICEWALGNAVFYSKNKLKHQKLIIRLHAQERFTDYPNKILYDNVDSIVFVGNHIKEECFQKFPIPQNICTIIGNIVNTTKYDLPKMGDSQFEVGLLGISPMNKRLHIALDILEELKKIDHRYRLRIKGQNPAKYDWLWARTKEREYYLKVFERINNTHLRYSVTIDPFGNDVEKWFQLVDTIISTSEKESFHMAIAEGISSGSTPIVWKREGSSEIFPTVVKSNSPNQAAKLIDFYRRNKAGMTYKKISKDFILKNYDSKIISQKWQDLISLDLEKDVNFLKKDINKVIVIFSIGSWEQFHRKEMFEALARELNERTHLLVIEPGNHYNTIKKLELSDEFSLNQMLKLQPIQVGDNISKIRIMNDGLPSNQEIHEILKKYKKFKDAIYFSIKKIFNDDCDILYWIHKPEQHKWIYEKTKFIYEIYDEYTMNFETGELKEEIKILEQNIMPLAQHVFYTSVPLFKRKSMYSKNNTIIENGVNFKIFNKYVQKTDININKGRYSIGYLGNLSNFFNWELMYEIVSALPEIDFIFHGQLEIEQMLDRKIYVEKLVNSKNVIFTGRVTREEGAVAINCYDILIIPFVVNEAMHAVNPLKLWEYLATGKPIISTPMDAIKIKEPYIFIKETSEDWIKCIKKLLKEDNFKDERITLASAHSWENKAKEYIKYIQ